MIWVSEGQGRTAGRTTRHGHLHLDLMVSLVLLVMPPGATSFCTVPLFSLLPAQANLHSVAAVTRCTIAHLHGPEAISLF